MSKTDFLKQFDAIKATFPVQGKARAAIHNGLDFPTTRDEYWKYTRVSPLISNSYKQHDVKVEDIKAFSIPELEAITITFVNGVFAPHLSDQSFPSGLNITSMQSVEAARRDEMLEHLGSYTDNEHQAFTALNTSYFKDGAFITVAKNTNIERPIRILNLAVGEEQASNARNLIVLEDNASAKFISQYEGNENKGSFTNALSEIVVRQGAHAAFYLIQNEGMTSSQINTIQVVQEKDSTVRVMTVTKSGKLVRNNLNFDVRGEGCESNMYGIYFTDDRQHVDNHTYVDHLVPNCNSNELYKGVMSGRSTGVFNGKIMVRQDAQQINAFQSNQNILLSDTATVNSKPELEIYADDVKCSHGCTIGQLDEEAMFYLQSRGLGKKAATQLLVRAFAAEVIEQVEIEALQKDMEMFIANKFIEINA